MADILHRIGATATPDQVYGALTTLDGLAAWWTTDTQGDSAPGGTIKFRFGNAGGFDMKVLDQRPNERVEWEVTDGPGHVPDEPEAARPDRHRRPVPAGSPHQQLVLSPAQ